MRHEDYEYMMLKLKRDPVSEVSDLNEEELQYIKSKNPGLYIVITEYLKLEVILKAVVKGIDV